MQVQQLGHWHQLAHDGDQHPETFVAKFETANQIPLRHVSPDARGKCRKYRNGKGNWTCPEILNVAACESYGPFFWNKLLDTNSSFSPFVIVLAKSVFLTRHWVHLLASSARITRVQVSCSLWVQGQLHD